jgi:DNA-directed RNA polymerase subunit RPC12/RpoP
MAEKIMVCDDCGKMFRISYEAAEGEEIKCPSCDSSNIVSIYKKMNIKREQV